MKKTEMPPRRQQAEMPQLTAAAMRIATAALDQKVVLEHQLIMSCQSLTRGQLRLLYETSRPRILRMCIQVLLVGLRDRLGQGQSRPGEK